MTEYFLCKQCRIWLYQNQHEIPNRCYKAYKLTAVGDLDSALQSIGSVFEMSKVTPLLADIGRKASSNRRHLRLIH